MGTLVEILLLETFSKFEQILYLGDSKNQRQGLGRHMSLPQSTRPFLSENTSEGLKNAIVLGLAATSNRFYLELEEVHKVMSVDPFIVHGKTACLGIH